MHERLGGRPGERKTKRENIINSYQFIKIIFVHCFISRYDSKRAPHKPYNLYRTYRGWPCSATTKNDSTKVAVALVCCFHFWFFFPSLIFFRSFRSYFIYVIIILCFELWWDGKCGEVPCAGHTIALVFIQIGELLPLLRLRIHCVSEATNARRRCVRTRHYHCRRRRRRFVLYTFGWLFYCSLVICFYLFDLLFRTKMSLPFLLLIDILHRERRSLFWNWCWCSSWH